MSEPSKNQIKLFENLPKDMVEHIISFLPIQSVLKNRVVSKKFRDAGTQSRDLDFSRLFYVRRNKLDVVRIIENVFHHHKAPEINRFILFLNHIGVEDKILSWIKTCLGKNIQELVLDFSKSKKIMEIPIDFLAIETLTVLKLHCCRFEIPDNPPKGLKLLKTLSLMQTDVTKEMIDGIFSNSIHLETLELIECRMYGILSINARNHKKFKSLVVFSMPNLLNIVLDAPTLEYYKYEGYVRMFNFLSDVALKEAQVHYNRSFDLHYYDSSNMVVANMEAYTKVYVLATTNIFLEALTYRYVGGERLEKATFWFWNLRKFQIFFIAPTFCSLFDIAEFLKHCPNLERVVIDINNFTFEPGLFWEIHHKPMIQEQNYLLKSIRKVKINGYKGHSHEVDIVKFFVKNAQSLEKLKLTMSRKAENEAYGPDSASINFIKRIFPKVEVIEV